MIAGAASVVVVVAKLLSTQCSGAACPDPCTACAFQPEQGANPSPEEYQQLFRDIAQRQGAADLPDVGNLENGVDRTRTAAELPCRLLPAVGAVESSITEFCSGNGLTVISFDCGFGVMQVTSGASSYPGIQSRADINIAAGADILATKWNDDADFGGHFGDSDPSVLESWYFAVWAYNGFVYSNNPNNPSFGPREPFNSPGGSSRGSYPYEELVWGMLEFPETKDGVEMWPSVAVTYPNYADIPNQSGLFSVAIPLPSPTHVDNCVEVYPPTGCPPDDQRELIVDDADATFAVDGDDVQTHDTGGFRDRFFSAPVAGVGAAGVRAHFEGIAPSSGTFQVAGFVPLDPATCTDVHVVVHGRGAPKTLSLDEGVIGGSFQNLGQVVLLQGERVVVEVTNETSDADATHRVGIDAFRFTWLGDGAVNVGDGCGDDVDCAGDALCTNGACADGCEASACTEGDTCDRATGACVVGGGGEGEGVGGDGEGVGVGVGGDGEGEGEGDTIVVPTPPAPGCTCGAASPTYASRMGVVAGLAALAALAGLTLLGRRRSARGVRVASRRR